MIVGKAVKMAEKMNVPVLGIVENMSYFECPTCHDRHEIFGSSHVEQLAQDYQIDSVAKLPIASEIAALCDSGKIEEIQGDWLDEIADKLSD